MKEEGKRMSDLTNNLLLLSRIDYEQETSEHGRQRIVFKLSDACLEAALPFESIAFEQGINYEMKVSENIYAKGVPEDVKQRRLDKLMRLQQAVHDMKEQDIQ